MFPVASKRKKYRKSIWLRYVRRWRYVKVRLLRSGKNPKLVARGLALGVFAGCFPIFGFQIIFGVLLAAVFRGNKFAAAIGTWVSNPLTYLPLFVFNYKVGNLLLGGKHSGMSEDILAQKWQSWSTLLGSGTNFLLQLFVGCFVVGIFASVVAYFASLKLIIHGRNSWNMRRKM